MNYSEFMLETQARNLEIIEAHKNGVKPKDIAEKYGITRARVSQILKRNGSNELPKDNPS